MPDLAITVDQLLNTSEEELDDLFRRSPAGEIPDGEGVGTVVFAPDSVITETAAKLAHLIAWKGKVFDRAAGTLRNEVGPLGTLAIRANVYRDKSWLDGQDSIILDYSKTSLVAQWIRDEIRLVAPGLYLGIVYWEHDKILHFTLDFTDANK
jgi:hypothetical protein